MSISDSDGVGGYVLCCNLDLHKHRFNECFIQNEFR